MQDNLGLAAQLAHQRVLDSGVYPIWVEQSNGDLNYTEEAQDIFNEYYDTYETVITDYKL